MFRRKSVSDIEKYAKTIDFCFSERELSALAADPRKGVAQIMATLTRREHATAAEQQRLFEMLQYEEDLWTEGYTRVMGIDEVGRGPLAGPVTVGGVILSRGTMIPGVNDSKLLTSKRRQELALKINSTAMEVAVASRDERYIDKHGIMAAITACQLELVERLRPDYLLLDAFALPGCTLPQKAIIKGDQKSKSIAAASIIAKVHRDDHMEEMAQVYPGFGFESHKGYGCKEHYQALFTLGPCPLHRRSYLGFMKSERGPRVPVERDNVQ